MAGYQLTAIVERDNDEFVARCVELDIVTRGASAAASLSNLKQAVASFVATAKDSEILALLTRETEVTLFEIERA